MRAVVIALGAMEKTDALNSRFPTPMLPLVDRPFIQHIVEHLVSHGVTSFDLILGHLPELIEAHLGDGARWGTRINYHLCSDKPAAWQFLRTLDIRPDEEVLLGRADCLPDLGKAASGDCTRGRLWVDAEGNWTEWALLNGASLESLSLLCLRSGSALGTAKDGGWELVAVGDGCFLDGRSYSGLIQAQKDVISRSFPGLLISGHEVDDRVWVSRNVAIRPNARVIGPVFIGENCDIGVGVMLGPNVSVGRDCVVDSWSDVSDAVICPGSYVGEALDIINGIVDKNVLANVSLDAVISVADEFILGSLSHSGVGSLVRRFASKLSAGILLLLFWPIMLATCLALRVFRRGPVIFRRELAKIPSRAFESGIPQTFRRLSFTAEEHVDSRLKDILLRFLPQLVNVVRGQMRFVGVRPRSVEEVQRLGPDWRMLHLSSQAGIVTEADLTYGATPSQEETYSAEAYFSVRANWAYNLRLLMRYLFNWSRPRV
jgi:lipopolysaccharide/colanic/teichoic acid biosynthesis glycosyltransferase